MATVIDKDLGYSRIFKDIKSMDGKGVKVGVMGGGAVADYAVYNEFGTSRIPARPFMQHTADQKYAETMKFSEHLVGKMIDGAITPEIVLKNLGEFYSNEIKMTIRNAKEWATPNAPATIKAKGSSSPLIDTGRLIGSIRYEVISK